jgi:Zn-finger nucleic acid-binding protein
MDLLEFTYLDTRIDQCAHCQGIWLDQGELEQISQARKSEIFSLELVEKQVRAEEEETRLRLEGLLYIEEMHNKHCPRCLMNLEKILFHQVQLDHCSKCGGVWLDKGEFEQVAGIEHGFLKSLERLLKPSVVSE